MHAGEGGVTPRLAVLRLSEHVSGSAGGSGGGGGAQKAVPERHAPVPKMQAVGSTKVSKRLSPLMLLGALDEPWDDHKELPAEL